MIQDQVFLHHAAPDQVLLDDLFENVRVAAPVPCAFGVDQGDRPALADAKTVGLRPADPALFGEPEFLET